MSDLAFYCFQYALALLLAPLLPGIIARIKAKVAGRHGKPVLQLYFDIFKGLRKGEVISQVTTPVFTLGPVVGLATVLCCPWAAWPRRCVFPATFCWPPTCWAWGAF